MTEEKILGCSQRGRQEKLAVSNEDVLIFNNRICTLSFNSSVSLLKRCHPPPLLSLCTSAPPLKEIGVDVFTDHRCLAW